ncbi:hypothetical protein FQR65_LT10042 [Abscondita terminalis]|nr:hypothetical protein FQR65_LT10042 [Abscondita terminalis]
MWQHSEIVGKSGNVDIYYSSSVHCQQTTTGRNAREVRRAMATVRSVNKRKNFTQREKETLVSVVAKYKNIIEDKSTKAFMVDRKNSAWEEIALNFNSCAETGTRTSKQLKVLYENIKRETKKTVAEQHHDQYEAKLLENEAKHAASLDKIEVFKTGGGSANLVLSSEQEILLATIRDQVDPLPNEFDNAAEYFNEIEMFNPIPGPSVSVPMPQPPQVPVPVIEPLEVSVPVPEVTRPKRIRKRKTNEELKRQFYFEKIKTEKLQRVVLSLQAKKLRLEINMLKQ